MSDYLEGYGVEEERREKLKKRIGAALLLACVLGVAAYFTFRDWSEKKQVDRFFALLRAGDYKAAYELWGCTEANPCRDYSFESFLEDWGPSGVHGNPDAFEVVKTRHCSTGIIRTLRYQGKEEIHLYVNRADRVLSFSPWPICDPRIKPPI